MLDEVEGVFGDDSPRHIVLSRGVADEIVYLLREREIRVPGQPGR
jgi:hypothetical protein